MLGSCLPCSGEAPNAAWSASAGEGFAIEDSRSSPQPMVLCLPEVERIDDDRVRVWRYLRESLSSLRASSSLQVLRASSHVDAAQARQTPHRWDCLDKTCQGISGPRPACARQLLLNLMLSQSDSPLRRLVGPRFFGRELGLRASSSSRVSTATVLGQADVLTRIEDLAFILCWADEQGSVAISVSM